MVEGRLFAIAAALGWIVHVSCGSENPGASRPESGAGPAFERVAAGTPAVTDAVLSAGGSWVDFDADGDLDLFVNGTGQNRMYRNRGDGTLERMTRGAFVTDTIFTLNGVWADYDNDGHLDLYMSQSRMGTEPALNVLFRGDGAPERGFTAVDIGEVPTVTSSATWVDVDNDGWVDIYAPGGHGARDLLLRNRGGTAFAPVQSLPFLEPNPPLNLLDSWIDYDGDGDQDLYKVFRRGPNRLFANMLAETGAPFTFREVIGSPLTSEGEVWDIAPAWGDYDNDGDLDLFLSVMDAPNRLYRNEGGGAFARIRDGVLVADSIGVVFGVWGDYDNDGDLDLFAANPTSALYRNEGEAGFVAIPAAEAGDAVARTLSPQAGHWGDYDGDGDLDLFMANFAIPANPRTGTPQPDILLRNERGSARNWLYVRLVGTQSNRSGIGAVIRAKARPGERAAWQARTVFGGPTGNNFQADLRAHFGLGDAETVDSLVVEWPSGVVQVLENLGANETVAVIEPGGR